MTLKEYIKQHTTVEEFANKIGKSRQTVHRYLRGENVPMSVMKKIQLATGGKVKPSSFFESPKGAA